MAVRPNNQRATKNFRTDHVDGRASGRRYAFRQSRILRCLIALSPAARRPDAGWHR